MVQLVVGLVSPCLVWLPWVHCCRSSLFLCVHLPPMCCLLALSEQTLQSHGEYLKEQISAYQGKARKIARGIFWLDHMLVNTIHSCAVIRCGTVAMLDGVPVTVWGRSPKGMGRRVRLSHVYHGLGNRTPPIL